MEKVQREPKRTKILNIKNMGQS